MTTTPPTNPTPESIEQQLASATQWTGGDTALWERALEQVERESKPARPSILATINRHARMAAMIGVASIAVIIAAVTASQTARGPDRSESSYSVAASNPTLQEGDFNAIRGRRVGDDIVLGRNVEFTSGEDTLIYRLLPSPASDRESYAVSPNTLPGKPEPAADAQFDRFGANNDRFASAAESMRPGSDNPLSQVFSGQHANLPPAPEVSAAAHRELAVAPAAPSADHKLAMSKSVADPEQREQTLDGERYDLRDMAKEAAGPKREEAPTTAAPAAVQPRAIVRTVNINLGVDDVRAAFTSIESAVSTSPASFIESSELRGEGRTASASLVIRVPAPDLDPLVAAIRPLGKVLIETSTAQDVGEQLVDLQARMTNAERFERELLETLNKTSGAKPNEILEVQRAVAGVRETIERLSAQSARLGRQIALSTIRISLSAEPADPTPARVEGLSAYLGRQLFSAWRSGLVAVADSFAWLISIIVGGALWWALLIIAALILRRWLKKRAVR